MTRRSRRAVLACLAGGLAGSAGCSALRSAGDEGTPTLTPAPAPTRTPTPAPGEGWPTFQQGPGHDGRNPTATELRERPRLAWTVPAGGGQPVVVGRRVYLDGGGVAAVGLGDGTDEWRADPGADSGLTAVADRVVAASSLGGGASLVAVGRDGGRRWAVRTEENVALTPTTAGDRVYGLTASIRRIRPRYEEVSARFLAVEAGGTVAWERHVVTERTAFSRTVTVGDAVYVGSLESVLALDRADGTTRWRYESSPANGDGTVDVFRTPTLAGDTLYASGRDRLSGAVVALAPGTGERRWRTELPTFPDGGVAAAAGRVVAGTQDGRVHALDAATGEHAWRASVGAVPTKAPAVVGRTVYAASGTRLAALALGDGRARWRAGLPARAVAPPVAVGRTLLVNTRGPLVALRG